LSKQKAMKRRVDGGVATQAGNAAWAASTAPTTSCGPAAAIVA
jgi:hypothetical protein